jgi:phosphohistidine phosphatase
MVWAVKYLFLLRHGQAEAGHAGTIDENRALTDIGIRQIKALAARFKEKIPTLDYVISSPAVRARQTADVFLRELTVPQYKLDFVTKLYSGTSIDTMKQVVASIDDRNRTLLIIGHNPVTEETATYFCPSFRSRLPPGGLVALTLPVTTWKGLRQGTGVLEFVLLPE